MASKASGAARSTGERASGGADGGVSPLMTADERGAREAARQPSPGGSPRGALYGAPQTSGEGV